eukprot:1888480-Prymnesium_polylepis.2
MCTKFVLRSRRQPLASRRVHTKRDPPTRAGAVVRHAMCPSHETDLVDRLLQLLNVQPNLHLAGQAHVCRELRTNLHLAGRGARAQAIPGS